MALAARYDVICRDGSLGGLLAALFLAREGKRVLVLPPLEAAGEAVAGEFILPVVSHGAARLLAAAELLPGETAPAGSRAWFDCTAGEAEVSCPADPEARREFFAAFCHPHQSWWQKLREQVRDLGRRLEEALAAPMMLPPLGLRDYGSLIKLLGANQPLLAARRTSWPEVIASSPLAAGQREFFLALPFLASQYNYRRLPFLACAYGLYGWLDGSARWLDLERLRRRLREQLAALGGEFAGENHEIVFDGKWYIGIGREGRLHCRSGVFIGPAAREYLQREIRPLDQRRDFFRQFDHLAAGCRLRQLHWPLGDRRQTACSPARPVYIFPPAAAAPPAVPVRLEVSRRGEVETAVFSCLLPGEKVDRETADRLHEICRTAGLPPPAAGVAWQEMLHEGHDGGRERGYQPRLAPVLGGAFLPASGIYRRFYQLGWENLPGFGLNGLVWAAKKNGRQHLDFQLPVKVIEKGAFIADAVIFRNRCLRLRFLAGRGSCNCL